MADLIAEVDAQVNYYTPNSIEIPLNTVGFTPGATFRIQIETLEYSGVNSIGYDVYFRRPLPDDQSCFHWSGNAQPDNPAMAVDLTFPPPPQGVEWGGPANATGCLDFTRAIFSARSYTYPGADHLHARITLTFSAVTAPGNPCQYGTQLKAGEPIVDLVSTTLLAAALSRLNASFLMPYLQPLVGTAVNKTSLCGAQPPTIPELTPYILMNTGYYVIPILHAVLWDLFCECTPGEVPPTPYPPPVLVEPPGSPPAPVYTPNPDNPCLDITEILRRLDAIQRGIGLDLQLDTFVQRQLAPGGTGKGATWSGLTGSGSFAINAAIGVQIVVTERVPGRSLEGAPPYIWDVGWASIMDDNGFIQERRITRDVEVWMPRLMTDATTFGYFLKDGVTADITLLHALP
jgi:hypothetical protein